MGSNLVARLGVDVPKYLKYPVPMLITAARTSYPWPLMMGTLLGSIISFRGEQEGRPIKEQSGYVFSLVFTFVAAMFGGLFTSWAFFVRVPGVLYHPVVLPFHAVAWCVVQNDVAFDLLSGRAAVVLDMLALADGFTTAFNMMEEAHGVAGGQSPLFSILVGTSVMMGGAIMRHFMDKGWVEGAATLDSKIVESGTIVVTVMGAYHYLAIQPCNADAACIAETGMYESLSLVAIAAYLAADALARRRTTAAPKHKTA